MTHLMIQGYNLKPQLCLFCAFLFWFCLWEFHLVSHLARIFYVALLQEYIHRVGRTARGEGAQGRALLFLIPEELGFLRYLKVCLILQQYLASPMNLHHNLTLQMLCVITHRSWIQCLRRAEFLKLQ